MSDILIGTVKNISLVNYDMFTGETLIPTQVMPVFRSTDMHLWIRNTVKLEDDVQAGLIEITDLDDEIVPVAKVGAWLATSNDLQPYLIEFMLNQDVPNSGERYFKWHASITMSEIPLILTNKFALVALSMSVDKTDPDREYGLRIYAETDLITPVYESGVILPILTLDGHVIIPVSPTAVGMGGGVRYILAAYRATGTGKSKFKKIISHMFLVGVD